MDTRALNLKTIIISDRRGTDFAHLVYKIITLSLSKQATRKASP